MLWCAIIYEKKHINVYINNTKELLTNFSLGEKSIGALLFWILKPFIEPNGSKTQARLKDLGYKVLKIFPIAGVQLLRYLGRTAFKVHFSQWLSMSHSHKSKNPITCRVDGTKSGRKYGFSIPELQLLFDHVTNSRFKTHDLYVTMISIGHKDFIVDFLIKKKDDKGGVNRIVQRMIYNLCNSMGKHKAEFKKWVKIALDGAWGKGEILAWFTKHGFLNTVVKSGGVDLVKFQWKGTTCSMKLKKMEKFLIEQAHFKSFNACHHLEGQYFELTGLLISAKVSVKIVLYRFQSKKGKTRYLMLLSLRQDWYSYQILKAYKGRWPIEVMFRTCKQVLKIEKYSFHSEGTDNIEMFFALRFIGYMWLNWYRVAHTRPSITPLEKVVMRWRGYLNGLSPKAFQCLFSG
jgi:hypothetical protein